jgi:hypothetical protein
MTAVKDALSTYAIAASSSSLPTIHNLFPFVTLRM